MSQGASCPFPFIVILTRFIWILQVFVVLVSALVAYAEGAAIGAPMAMMRAPQFDSATIEHERLGGNFAYKTMEAHAYAAVSPVIENVPTQVGVSYAHRPIFGQVTYHVSILFYPLQSLNLWLFY